MDIRDVKNFIKDIMGYVILLVIIVLLGIYVVSFKKGANISMKPTIDGNDIVLLNKIAYKITSVKRNDIVLFKNGKTLSVQRVIGLPNENIEYLDNVLYINGIPYEETIISEDTKNFTMKNITGNKDDRIPEDMYLVIGDDRSVSNDSKEYTLINKKDIVGKTSFRIWPLNKIGFVK